MKTFLVVGQAQSEADEQSIIEGRLDTNLSELGHKQAEALGEYISVNYRVDKIYCSTLKRAYQTAQHLASHTKVLLTPNEFLIDCNEGELQGKQKSDIKHLKMNSEKLHESVYGQESKLSVAYRAECAISKILSETKENETVVIVSHDKLISQLCSAFLRLPVDSNMFFQTQKAAIHEWRIENGMREIVYMNKVEHLLK